MGKAMAKVDMTSLTILVIDDEAFVRNLLVRLLREIGVGVVVTAGDGSEGLTKVSKGTDLVICDLEMPQMDGFEFVRTLRSSSTIPRPDVPVLIVTGHSEEETVRGAIGLGINGYLVKPVSKQALEARISAAITLPMIDPAKLKR